MRQQAPKAANDGAALTAGVAAYCKSSWETRPEPRTEALATAIITLQVKCSFRSFATLHNYQKILAHQKALAPSNGSHTLH